MTRRFSKSVLALVLSMLAVTGSGMVGPDSTAAEKTTSHDPRFVAWLAAAVAADSATISTLQFDWPVGADTLSIYDRIRYMRVLGRVRVGHEWIARFVGLLGGPTRYMPDSTCLPHEIAPADMPAALVLRIRFGEEGEAPAVMLLMKERCGQLQTGDRLAGSVGIDSVASGLLELVPGGMYVYVEDLPEAIKKVQPRYPSKARRAGAEGTVLVQVLVGRDGAVKDVRIVKSIPLLDEPAVEAVKQWRFKPASAKGKPLAVWVAIPVKFTLK